MSLIVAPQSPLLVLPGAVPFVGPLDALPTITVGFSLRRLLSAYTANKAINIRATGDNATTDIGFTSAGDLDTTTLSAFLTTHGGSAAVTKWYDQSGNGNDASQATAASQPTITLNSLNGHPVLTFLATSSQGLVTSFSPNQPIPFTVNVVARETVEGIRAIFGDSTADTVVGFFTVATGMGIQASSQLVAAYSLNTYYSLTGVFNGASSIINQNGTEITGTVGGAFNLSGTLEIGEVASSSFLSGNIAEAVVWFSQISSANRSTVHANQSTYYGIA